MKLLYKVTVLIVAGLMTGAILACFILMGACMIADIWNLSWATVVHEGFLWSIAISAFFGAVFAVMLFGVGLPVLFGSFGKARLKPPSGMICALS